MKTTRTKLLTLPAAALIGAFAFGNANAALDISGMNYVTYGDGNSYALQVEGVIAGSTGPGSPYYVTSTPGAIQDLIVVATGSNGAQVTTNYPGMDNALATPNGSGTEYFSGVWSSTLSAFTSFLNGENPLFFFNNNQTNSGSALDQNVAVWAQISLTGAGMETLYFDFTNQLSPYAVFGGGVLNGDVTAYTSTGAGPITGTNQATDYVLSGGAVCLTAANTPVACTDPNAIAGSEVNNNLGANQAAYAIDAPELNAFLAAWLAGDFAGYTDINIDLRYGCAPGTAPADCIGRSANNGFEQLFIGTAVTVTQVPEPGTLALLAVSLLGLGTIRRRQKN